MTSPRPQTSSTKLPPATRQEYVYICASEQMPGVFKVGETHRQTPDQRAIQLPGVDKKTKWAVVRAFVSPHAKFTETLAHRRLRAMGASVDGYREIFSVDLETLIKLLTECVSHTPVPPKRELSEFMSGTVAVPQCSGPWHLALSLHVQHVDEPEMTLARAMARAAAGDDRLRRRLHTWGVELVYPDDEKPAYRFHAIEDSIVTRWLRVQGLVWQDFAVLAKGSRKVTCLVQ